MKYQLEVKELLIVENKMILTIMGTIEDEKVKNEICAVMEGGVEAFQTRAKRYAALNGR